MLRAETCRAVFVTLWLQNTLSWQTFKAQARSKMPVSFLLCSQLAFVADQFIARQDGY